MAAAPMPRSSSAAAAAAERSYARTMVEYVIGARERANVARAVVYWALFLVLTFMFAYMFRLFVGPYRNAWDVCNERREKARIYLTETNTCTQSNIRAQLEGYNNCADAQRKLNRDCRVEAFYSLMDSLHICRNGVCTVFGINVTTSLWSVFQLLVIVAISLYIFSMLGVLASRHRSTLGAYSLPVAADGAGAMAAAAAAAVYANEQQQLYRHRESASHAGGMRHRPASTVDSEQYSPYTVSFDTSAMAAPTKGASDFDYCNDGAAPSTTGFYHTGGGDDDRRQHSYKFE